MTSNTDGIDPAFGRGARAVAAALARIVRTRHGGIGLAILLVLAVVAVTASWIAPYGAIEQTSESLAAPSREHLFGTDNIGRDIFSLVIFGTRASLTIGIGAALSALVLGGTVGILAGYFRGTLEAVLMRVTELFQTLPVIVFVLFAVALFGTSFWLLTVAVTLAIWPIEARLIYGQYLKFRERDFVAAAKVLDFSTWHIVMREILPNVVQPVVVQVALDASVAILIEAGLGFLGLSDPNIVSWGQLLFAAQNYMDVAWWMSLFPGLAICIVIIGLNLFADGLGEIANPRTAVEEVGLQRC
jgi:peptide/nickel transport system permease protein